MQYVVKAGYVSVETQVTDSGGRATVDIPRGAVLPDDVPDEQVESLLTRGLITYEGEGEAPVKAKRGRGSRGGKGRKPATDPAPSDPDAPPADPDAPPADPEDAPPAGDGEPGDDGDPDADSDGDDGNGETDPDAEPVEVPTLEELAEFDKDQLLEQAKNEGVEVDGRWAVDRILATITENRPK